MMLQGNCTGECACFAVYLCVRLSEKANVFVLFFICWAVSFVGVMCRM